MNAQKNREFSIKVLLISLIAISFDYTSKASYAFASNAVNLIEAAQSQIGVTTQYDGSYKALTYPGGDVPLSTGVCVDVVIRAYRDAFAIDL